jgi:hypothetical protein
MAEEAKPITYRPPDQVIERFHASKALVRGLVGCRGSGKSGACIMESLQGAAQQKPNHEGKRRTRFLVLRDTYRQLETTTIPSFMKWMGHGTRLTGQYPIHGRTRIPLPDDTSIEMETIFLAMDGDNIIDNLQSFETTFAWVNEARAIENSSVVNMIISSCGRYPSKDEEGCTSSYVVMDTNPCDEYHWWYKSHMDSTPSNWEFFAQESPLIYLPQNEPVYKDDPQLYAPNPKATYARIQNKGYRYWLDQIPNASDAFIRTMIMGKYGTVVAGRPVYGQWWSEDCVSNQALDWNSTMPILIGIDTSGLHPAAVVGQVSGGSLKILRELRAENCPFDEFCEAMLTPMLAAEFRTNPIICSLDPSNPRSGVGGRTARAVLQGYGVDSVLAPSNRFDSRMGAVVKFLQRRGALKIDPSCKLTITGFRGKYHYKKIEGSGAIDAYKPVPEKNSHADVHDALQYLCLYLSAGMAQQKVIVERKRVLMV